MRCIYQVPAIYPLKSGEEGPGRHGFSTSLDWNFAILARKTNMPQYTFGSLQSEGKDIIERYALKDVGEMGRQAYHFIENSWLLRFVQVPGDACDLGLSDQDDFMGDGWSKHLKFSEELKQAGQVDFPLVRYVPHNVDNLGQASALLALWLHWANTANILIEPER